MEDTLENAPDAEEQFRVWEENRKLAAHITEVCEQARMKGFPEGFYTGFVTMQGNLRISGMSNKFFTLLKSPDRGVRTESLEVCQTFSLALLRSFSEYTEIYLTAQ